MPLHHRFIKWSHEERRNLELGVRYQNQAIESAKLKMEYKGIYKRKIHVYNVLPSSSCCHVLNHAMGIILLWMLYHVISFLHMHILCV